MNMFAAPRRLVSLLCAALCLPFAACSSVGGRSQDPLDADQWRSAKSRMYQDLARQCLQAQDHERAQRLLQQAVQFDSGDRKSLELLAQIAHASGDLATAASAAEMLLRLQPESVAAWCTIGAVAEAKNQPEAAENAYRRALRAAADDPRPAIDLHRLLLTHNRDDEATALRDELTTRFPRRIEARLDHGAHLAAGGRWSAAAAAFEQALRIQPEDAGAATGMALGAVMSRAPADALALSDRLPPRARRENPPLQLTLAIARLQTGDYAAALRELEFPDPLLDDRVSLRVLRGEILFRMQRLDAAQAEFERAIQLAPDTTRAHAGLGRVLLLQKRHHAAVRALQLTVQLQPGHSANQAMLTAAVVAAGDLDAGRRQLAVLRRLPDTSALVTELELLYPRLAEPEATR